MRIVKRASLFVIVCLSLFIANLANAATSKIGILVFDGFLTSDVTKKAWFSSYEVVVISTTTKKEVLSEEVLQLRTLKHQPQHHCTLIFLRSNVVMQTAMLQHHQ